MQSKTPSPHRRASRAYQEQLPKVLKTLAFQLALRLAAFSPFLYTVITGGFFDYPKDHALAISLLYCLPLYFIIVMPFRFQAAAKKANILGFSRNAAISVKSYLSWLGAALLRLLLSLPFLLMLLGFFYGFYYYMRVPGFNDSLLFIQSIGKLMGGDYPEGIALIGLAGLLFSVLAAISWKSGCAFEHQPVNEIGLVSAMKNAFKLNRRRGKRINRTVFINALLTLPAILGVVSVLVLHILSLPSSGMLVFDFLNAVSVFLTLSFPPSTIGTILIVLAVLWLPLLPLRKLALSLVLTENVTTEGTK